MTIDFGDLQIQTQRIYIIKAAHDITLKPSSETISWARLTGKLTSGYALVTTHKTLQQMGFRTASALVCIDNDKPWIPLRILNPFVTTQTIKKGTRLAIAERLTVADIICEHDPNFSKTANVNTKAQQQVRFQPPDDFCKLFDLSESTFSDKEKQELLCLLWNFSDIFLKHGDKLKCTDVLEFEIKLKDDAQPFKACPYRSNPKLRKEISRQVKQMLGDDIIRPSTSSYGSPVLLVSKPDGTYRFVIDYRKLNSMTLQDNFPMGHL